MAIPAKSEAGGRGRGDPGAVGVEGGWPDAPAMSLHPAFPNGLPLCDGQFRPKTQDRCYWLRPKTLYPAVPNGLPLLNGRFRPKSRDRWGDADSKHEVRRGKARRRRHLRTTGRARSGGFPLDDGPFRPKTRDRCCWLRPRTLYPAFPNGLLPYSGRFRPKSRDGCCRLCPETFHPAFPNGLPLCDGPFRPKSRDRCVAMVRLSCATPVPAAPRPPARHIPAAPTAPCPPPHPSPPQLPRPRPPPRPRARLLSPTFPNSLEYPRGVGVSCPSRSRERSFPWLMRNSMSRA